MGCRLHLKRYKCLVKDGLCLIDQRAEMVSLSPQENNPMTPTESIWHNGRLIPWHDAKIHVLSHVVSYGSSVFEGIRSYETTKGPAVFRVREHMRRMIDSAKVYRMQIPYTL